jgi:sialic acid synthase SpsE
MGDNIMLASVAMGAKVIEKHYTLDRTMAGPDHAFGIEPHELKQAMKKLRDVEASFGDGLKSGPRPEEAEQMIRARRSLHVKRDIKAGEVLTEQDIITKRPSLGIAPYKKSEIIGKKVLKDIPEDHWITDDMIA